MFIGSDPGSQSRCKHHIQSGLPARYPKCFLDFGTSSLPILLPAIRVPPAALPELVDQSHSSSGGGRQDVQLLTRVRDQARKAPRSIPGHQLLGTHLRAVLFGAAHRGCVPIAVRQRHTPHQKSCRQTLKIQGTLLLGRPARKTVPLGDRNATPELRHRTTL